jgi:hypothetical protein
MPHPGICLSIKANGNERKVLRITENTGKHPKSRGDLYIDVVPARASSAGYFIPPPIGLKEQRFTIHNAEWRGKGDNRLNMHYTFANGLQSPPSMHYTKAIQRGRFAPLFFRFYPSLLHPHYDVSIETKRRDISLGEYDPSRSVMILATFASLIGQRVNAEDASDYSVMNLDFTKFTIVVVWCFLGPWPSQDFGLVGHPFTEQKIGYPMQVEFQKWLMEGLDEPTCKWWFIKMRDFLKSAICGRSRFPSDCIQTTRFFRTCPSLVRAGA